MTDQAPHASPGLLRPNTPPREKTTPDGRRVTTITLKRYCPDGHLVGDATEDEVMAVADGVRLPSVRLDCAACRDQLDAGEQR